MDGLGVDATYVSHDPLSATSDGCERQISKINCAVLFTVATCSSSCLHGSCTGPNTCTCDQGWQGDQCRTRMCNVAH